MIECRQFLVSSSSSSLRRNRIETVSSPDEGSRDEWWEPIAVRRTGGQTGHAQGLPDVRATCRTVPGLTRDQLELCYRASDVTATAIEGLEQGVRECQYQFQWHRWNCSSLSTRSRNPHTSSMLKRGYRDKGCTMENVQGCKIIADPRPYIFIRNHGQRDADVARIYRAHISIERRNQRASTSTSDSNGGGKVENIHFITSSSIARLGEGSNKHRALSRRLTIGVLLLFCRSPLASESSRRATSSESAPFNCQPEGPSPSSSYCRRCISFDPNQPRQSVSQSGEQSIVQAGAHEAHLLAVLAPLTVK
uniref:Protein Wnt n=1 Tax=Anopheles albimanus TaxID=7167 RepID=A0A182F0Y7_ANOAL